ncbi:MAG: phenylalanine--tRNA ligase subunit alpha [Chitinophagaceae bacterium]|nr:MAG: phenylalanine--tRNA ligase subunit alpha [Chitinophagaceae bacterium]
MSTDNQIFQEAEKLLEEVKQSKPTNKEELERFRIRFLGSKNILKNYFPKIKDISNERKKEYGQLLNAIKITAEEVIKNTTFSSSASNNPFADIDFSLPGDPVPAGSRHPVRLVWNRITDIFSKIGFDISKGPEIEDDYHNFSALNFAEDHPARDMQDTFFLNKNPDWVLRTHTSSVQVRVMENNQPPIRTISPGRVYRNETISARSHCFFHQIEGLVIDKNISMADLKQCLLYFAKEMFGEDSKIRLRPSYFPFTEPSAEMDVSCFICNGKGCNICKHTGWVEILGCGMVDPNVLKNCDIDPEVYSGYAFGMGVERIAMLKYKINDIRLFTDHDIRFLKQFSWQ